MMSHHWSFFFDLVFVFALSQASHYLSKHLSAIGFYKTLCTITPIMMVWAYTSWTATMNSINEWQTKFLVFFVLLLSVVMTSSITKAFGEFGGFFAISYCIIQIGSSLWNLYFAKSFEIRNHYIGVVVWFSISSIFWLTGVFTNNSQRLFLWGVAILIDILGTILAHPITLKKSDFSQFEFSSSHFLERCELLVIIGFGEVLFNIGNSLQDTNFNIINLVSALIATLITFELWFFLYWRVDKLVEDHFENSSNPINTSRQIMFVAFGNLLSFLLLAILFERIIKEPTSTIDMSNLYICLGGLILFLLVQSSYLFSISKQGIIRHVILIVSMVAGGWLLRNQINFMIEIMVFIILLIDFIVQEIVFTRRAI